MPKSRPFKKLFCDRPDLLKLPGSALKVWLCHFMHEGQDRKSWPSLETICEETDLEQRVVKKVRQQMLNGGWLEKSGDRSVKGQFKVPIITATRGVVPLPDYKPRVTKSHHGRSDKKSLRTRLQKVTMAEGQKVTMDPVTKSHLEVDPEKQVYPKRSISKDQVEGAHLSTANAFCVQDSKNAEAGSLAKIQVPELQKVTMVRSEPRIKVTDESVFDYDKNRPKGRRWSGEGRPGHPLPSGWIDEITRRNTLDLTPEQIRQETI